MNSVVNWWWPSSVAETSDFPPATPDSKTPLSVMTFLGLDRFIYFVLRFFIKLILKPEN